MRQGWLRLSVTQPPDINYMRLSNDSSHRTDNHVPFNISTQYNVFDVMHDEEPCKSENRKGNTSANDSTYIRMISMNWLQHSGAHSLDRSFCVQRWSEIGH
jgi:hypothetical protein